MKVINLFYLSYHTMGGWVTFTRHLVNGLKANEVRANLYKIGNRTEGFLRDFGYDLWYRNVTIKEAERIVSLRPSLIVATQKPWLRQAQRLVMKGAWSVVHDLVELKQMRNFIDEERTITIRRAMQGYLPHSTIVLHPYDRHYPEGTVATGSMLARSICRIDFDKNINLLLDANRRLPKQQQIDISGFENRIYTRYKICPFYPEWFQSVGVHKFDRTTTKAVELCHEAKFTCDLSVIKGEGGGTQYCFLEAMDAGSLNVLHKDWIRAGDEMVPVPYNGANCFVVKSGKQLAKTLLNRWDYTAREVRYNADILLRLHSSEKVVKPLIEVLFK